MYLLIGITRFLIGCIFDTCIIILRFVSQPSKLIEDTLVARPYIKEHLGFVIA